MILRLFLVALLLGQPACAGMSENNRRGLMLVGGAAVIVGALMIPDGVGCDPTTMSNQCEDDGRILALGVTTLVAGLALFGTMLYLGYKDPD